MLLAGMTLKGLGLLQVPAIQYFVTSFLAPWAVKRFVLDGSSGITGLEPRGTPGGVPSREDWGWGRGPRDYRENPLRAIV